MQTSYCINYLLQTLFSNNGSILDLLQSNRHLIGLTEKGLFEI